MDIPEINEEFKYWFFAHFLRMDPSQVDELPFDRMCYMIELEKEYQKQKKSLQ